MRYQDRPEQLTIREAFDNLTVMDLKPLLALVGITGLTRKGDLVEAIARVLEDPEQVRSLYARLDELAQKAVQEATHDPDGVWDHPRFRARYGSVPDLGGTGHYTRDPKPTLLRLFFPSYRVLPTNLRATLRTFVPPPPPLSPRVLDDLPKKVRRPHVNLGSSYRPPDPEEVEPRVRHTARAAERELKALLRLVDAGEVKVSDKTRRPGQATLQLVAGVLSDGDFYTEADRSKHDWDPARDLAIKSFAWPLLLQAGGLVRSVGGRLELTPAGRKATTRPSHETLRTCWNGWLKTTLLDEFNRIEAIKGQQSKGSLTAVVPRRQAVALGLRQCPPRKWLSVEEVWRILKVSRTIWHVARNGWKLYIAEARYGNFGDSPEYVWDELQGRFVLALLFEYAATLGLIDVAYIEPARARNDFRDHWGTDDLSCLSRYDGLLFIRINALGAWCLGLVDAYEPETWEERPVLEVLPNHDVVITAGPLDPADRLLLARFAIQTSDLVWHLESARALAAVEEGLDVAELREFLIARSQKPLPATVATLLDDWTTRVGRLEDLGAARLVRCSDAHVASVLAHDRRLRSLCQLAGDSHLVFRAADETAVRRALRELGYVLPPPHEKTGR